MNHLKNITGYYVLEQHAIHPSKLNMCMVYTHQPFVQLQLSD